MPGSIDSLVDNMWDLLYRITTTLCWLLPLFDPRGCPKNSNQLHPTEQNTQKNHIDVHRQTTKHNQKRHQVLKRRTTDTTRVFPFKNPLILSVSSLFPRSKALISNAIVRQLDWQANFGAPQCDVDFFPVKTTTVLRCKKIKKPHPGPVRAESED